MTQSLSEESLAVRGAFAAVLAAAMASSTFVQSHLGVLATFLIEEFDISRSRLGLLTTVAFLVGGLMSPAAGRLVDRLGGRRVMILSFCIVGLATLGMAAAPSYWWLLVSATATGVPLASANPTTNKLIAVHVPPGRRGVMVGIKQSGVQVGAFLIGALLPRMATQMGWRLALASSVFVPLLGIAGTLLWVADDRRPSITGQRASSRAPLQPVVWWMCAYAFLMGSGVASVTAYLPLFAREEVGFSVETAGLVASLVGLIGVISRIAWGWGSERFGRYSRALSLMAFGAVATVALILGAGSAGWLLWIAAILFGVSAITWNAVGMLVVVAEVEEHEAGRSSGWVLSGFYAGFVASPLLFGYSVDRTGSYVAGWVAIGLVFLAAAAVALLWGLSRRREVTKGASH
jgi:MFS family permease